MKIRLSRRIKTFIAKWGGLLVAAILVLPMAFFGGTYLYADRSLEITISYVSQAVTLNAFEAAGLTADLTQAVYHLTIGVINGTPHAAHVSITNARVFLDEYSFPIQGSVSWRYDVPGNNSLLFVGDIQVPINTYNELRNRVNVKLEITGTIAVSTHYSFVGREGNRPINISTFATFPAPPPQGPSDLMAILTKDNQAQLVWNDNSSNESGFVIDRSRDEKFTVVEQAFLLAANSTAYLDTSVVPGVTYFYRVKAKNDEVGDSGYSNRASITIPLAATTTPTTPPPAT